MKLSYLVSYLKMTKPTNNTLDTGIILHCKIFAKTPGNFNGKLSKIRYYYNQYNTIEMFCNRIFYLFICFAISNIRKIFTKNSSIQYASLLYREVRAGVLHEAVNVDRCLDLP